MNVKAVAGEVEEDPVRRNRKLLVEELLWQRDPDEAKHFLCPPVVLPLPLLPGICRRQHHGLSLHDRGEDLRVFVGQLWQRAFGRYRFNYRHAAIDTAANGQIAHQFDEETEEIVAPCATPLWCEDAGTGQNEGSEFIIGRANVFTSDDTKALPKVAVFLGHIVDCRNQSQRYRFVAPANGLLKG